MATLLSQIRAHPPTSVAVVEQATGLTRSYADLLRDARAIRDVLRSKVGDSSLTGSRILNLLPTGYAHTAVLLALGLARAIDVPQPPATPPGELNYVIQDAQVGVAFIGAENKGRASEFGLRHVFAVNADGAVEEYNGVPVSADVSVPNGEDMPSPEDGAIMLFTSGTTGRPKGVLMTHAALAAQCLSMGEAWKWSAEDRVLHVLPLTHIHGVVNCLATPLWHGATVEFMPPKFSGTAIWSRFLSPTAPKLTVFSAVPTIYSRLLSSAPSSSGLVSDQPVRAALSCVRLMMSGSAPLPSPLKQAWRELTEHVLLERYGMSETGMILGNPYTDAAGRWDAHVGLPLPGVEVRLVGEGGHVLGGAERGAAGEVQVRGAGLFREYWNLPAKTAEAFADDGWFRTGDVALRSEGAEGYYRLLGRQSQDIIKSGGEKVSALEVERVLMGLACVADAAVVAVPDREWGEVVGAVVVLRGEEEGMAAVEGGALRDRLRSELTAFKIPKKWRVYEDAIPRNAMGKVAKKELVRVAFPDAFAASTEVPPPALLTPAGVVEERDAMAKATVTIPSGTA